MYPKVKCTVTKWKAKDASPPQRSLSSKFKTSIEPPIIKTPSIDVLSNHKRFPTAVIGKEPKNLQSKLYLKQQSSSPSPFSYFRNNQIMMSHVSAKSIINKSRLILAAQSKKNSELVVAKTEMSCLSKNQSVVDSRSRMGVKKRTSSTAQASKVSNSDGFSM